MIDNDGMSSKTSVWVLNINKCETFEKLSEKKKNTWDVGRPLDMESCRITDSGGKSETADYLTTLRMGLKRESTVECSDEVDHRPSLISTLKNIKLDSDSKIIRGFRYYIGLK